MGRDEEEDQDHNERGREGDGTQSTYVTVSIARACGGYDNGLEQRGSFIWGSHNDSGKNLLFFRSKGL